MTKVFSQPDVLLELVDELSINIPKDQKPVLVMGMTLQSMENDVLKQVGKHADKVNWSHD